MLFWCADVLFAPAHSYAITLRGRRSWFKLVRDALPVELARRIRDHTRLFMLSFQHTCCLELHAMHRFLTAEIYQL